MIGEDELIHFSGVELSQDCTIVLRGAMYVLKLVCIILNFLMQLVSHGCQKGIYLSRGL